MFLKKTVRVFLLSLLIVSGGIQVAAAYDGSETWLHYTAVPAELKAGYDAACQTLVMSNAESDTLKNAKAELDLAITGLLGKTLTAGTAAAAGAIVLAPEGSPLVASAGLDFSAINTEGFLIKSVGGATYISGKNEVGVLRGVYSFLRLMQIGKNISNLDVKESPYFAYRVLDHWINHYGSSAETERVYGGGRPIKMERFGSASISDTRIRDYCRMAVSLGLNGICPDNVNTYRGGSIGNYKCLEESTLKTQKVFADILGTFGLKYYLSVSYASPRLVNPKKESANAYGDPEAKKWWFDKVDMVRSYISNFGGFLMKADSEGEEGPRSNYQLTQSQGANPMAEALKRYGYVLIWRTFIYDTSNPDFAVNQTVEFENQTWDDAVILRTKDGPRDFQTVEPPNQLLALDGVRHGMEFQITQEYTGQEKHVCWLVPKWKQVLDFDMKLPTVPAGTDGSVTYQILRGTGTAASGGGVWAISNLSDAKNWTGHYIHQANYYGYGRLSWDPTLSQEQIADEWIKCSFKNGHNPAVKYLVNDMLKKSWKTYEDYTISYSALMPAVGNDNHYEIGFEAMRGIKWYTEYFMHLTNDGIGVDRTMATGNKGVRIYTPELQQLFGSVETCPEDYILFFHHLPWEYKMKSGMTLIQSLYYNHFRGLRQVKRFQQNWDIMAGIIDNEIYAHVKDKLKTQMTDATRWTNTFKKDFGAPKYGTPVGCDLGIVTPNPDKAVTADVGAAVPLSVGFKDQKGTAVAETFNWSVDGNGVLSAATGENTSFSADLPGVYTVSVATATFPDLKDQVQIYVGDNWYENLYPVAVNSPRILKTKKAFMEVKQGMNHVAITTSDKSKISIIGLQGRVVKSIQAGKAGVYTWDTRNVSHGIYLIRINNGKADLLHKVILK